MTDYAELIKLLRSEECVPYMTMRIMREAADAIENLMQKTRQLKSERLVSDGNGGFVRKSRWIPVTERLPKYGERVLVFGGVTMYVAYFDKNRYGGESWHKLNSKSHYCNPSHWMPLPTPPKEETE